MRFVGHALLALALACGGSDATSTPPGSGGGQTPPVIGFSKRSTSASGVTFPYQVFAPTSYVATKKWPIVVALAGTEERGSDGEKQVTIGMGPLVRAQPNFPAVVIFPQVPSDATAAEVFNSAIFTIIDDVVRTYNGDPDRVYLTGLSYGGTEGFSLLYNTPGRFAAFLTISPGMCTRCIPGASTLDQANLLVAQKLKTVPVWVHQGDKDLAAAVSANRTLIADASAAGSTSWKYTEYPNLGHAIWDAVYAQSAVWDWVFLQRR